MEYKPSGLGIVNLKVYTPGCEELMNLSDYIHLSFPLNVYAYSLALHQGQVDYLHYGLVEEEEEAWEIGAHLAQQRATDLLLTHLPPPPCRILEVGLGLGTLTQVLATRGYSITAISPDPHQIHLVSPHPQLELQCVTFEAFNRPLQSYEVLIFQESAQYIKPLTLFNKAYDLLVDAGTLLIMDEVNLRRTPHDEVEGLPFLKYSLAQAQRCGFKLIEHLDLSKKAAPTLDFLLKIIETYHEQILAGLSLHADQLQALIRSLQKYQQKYRDGRYGYGLFSFQKKEAPRWRITEVVPHDEEAIRNLFAQVFQHPLSPEMWAWKYAQGRGMATVAWQGTQMVAHYGGIVRDILYFGQAQQGVQIVDVMVASTERSVLTRHGPYFLVGATFPECYAGYGAKILLGFGFPTARAIRVAELMGLYREVGKMIEIRWHCTQGPPKFWSQIRHLHPQERPNDREVINQLWECMHPDLHQAIVGVRDWHYVRHRYLAHPHKRYELLLVTKRFFGQPLGIVVLHQDPENPTLCKLLDIIAPLAHLPLLIEQTRRIVAHWGKQTLSLWMTEQFAPLFPGGEHFPIDVRIPHCVWYEGPPTEEVQGHWWLMGGDTDFM